MASSEHLQQLPVCNVFKYAGDAAVRGKGDVTNSVDRAIGKVVYRIGGTVSSANFLAVTGKNGGDLRLYGRFIYIQFMIPQGSTAPFSTHIECVTRDEQRVRISLSSSAREARATGHAVVLPCTFMKPGRWAMVALDLNSLLQLHMRGASLAYIRGLEFCAAQNVRNVFTSDLVYAASTLSRDMTLPVPKGQSWDSLYDFFWIPSTPDASFERATSDSHSRHAAAPSLTPEQKREHFRKLHGNEGDDGEKENASESTALTLTPARKVASARASSVKKQVVELESPSSKSRLINLSRVIGFSGSTARALIWSADGHEAIFAADCLVVSQNLVSDESNALSALRTSAPQRFFVGHTDVVTLIERNADGTILATAQHGKHPVIRVWNYATGDCLIHLAAHPRGVTSIAFSADGLLMAAAGFDLQNRQLIVVWRIDKLFTHGSVEIIAKQISEFSISRLVFSPYAPPMQGSKHNTSDADEYDQRCLVSCGRDNVRFWRIKSGHLPGFCVALNEHARTVFTDLAFEAGALAIPSLPPTDGSKKAHLAVPRKLFASTAGGAVFQINYTDRSLECVYQLHSGAINCMRLNEGFCVTASADRYLRVWPLDFSDFFLEAQHETAVTAVDISSDGLKVLSGTSGGAVALLDVARHDYHKRLRAHTGDISVLLPDPNAQRNQFASVSTDGTLRVWEQSTLLQLYEFSAAGEVATCLAYHPSPNQHLLACGFTRGHVRIFDVAATKTLVEYQQHASAVCALQFSPCGTRLYSAATDGQLCVYDAERMFLPVRLLSGLAPAGTETESKGNKDDHSLPTQAPLAQLSDVKLAISRTGAVLAVASVNKNSVVLMCTRTWVELRRISTGLHGGIRDICFLYDSAGYGPPSDVASDDIHPELLLRTVCVGESLSVVGGEGRVVVVPLVDDKGSIDWHLPGRVRTGLLAHAQPAQTDKNVFQSVCISASGHGSLVAYFGSDSLLHVARRPLPFVSAAELSTRTLLLSDADASIVIPPSDTELSLPQDVTLTGAPKAIRSMFWSRDGRELICASGAAVLVWRVDAALMSSPAERAAHQLAQHLMPFQDDARREVNPIIKAVSPVRVDDAQDDVQLLLTAESSRAPDAVATVETAFIVSEPRHTPFAIDPEVENRGMLAPTQATMMKNQRNPNDSDSAEQIAGESDVEEGEDQQQVDGDNRIEQLECSMHHERAFAFSSHARNHLIWHRVGGFLVFASGSAVILHDLLGRQQRMLGGPGRAHGLNSGHTHDVSALAMSPDGQLIVSASSAEEVCHTVNGLVRVAPMYLWSTRTAAVVGSLMMHSHGIQALCFDSTGELLASVGGPFDNRLCVWHIPSQRLLATVSLASHESCAHSVIFLSSPFDVNCAGNVVPPLLLAVSGRSGLILWTLDGSLAAHVGEVEHDVMSLVPQVVARTTDAGMFDQSWLTLHTGCAGQWALAPNAAPTSMAYCSRAQLLVVGTQNGALMLFQMPPLPTTNVQFDESDAVMRQFSSGRLSVTELPVPRLWSATRVLSDAEVVTLHMSPLTSADSRDSVFYTIVIGSSESASALHRVMLRVPAAVGASVALLPADDSRPVTAKQRAVVRSSVSTKEQQKAAQFKRRLDEETRLQKAALMGALAASPSGKRTPRAAPSQRGLSAWFVAEDWFAEGATLRLDGAVVASQLDAAGEMGLVGTSVGTIWQVDLRRVTSAAQPSHVLAVGNSAAATRLLHAHSDSVHAVVFHPRVDDLLASAAADGSLRVWKRGAHQQIVHHQVTDAVCSCVQFIDSAPLSPQSASALHSASDSSLVSDVGATLLRLLHARRDAETRATSHSVRSSHSSLGSLVAGYSDGAVRLFDLQHLNVVAKTQLSSPVTALMVVLPDEEQDIDASYIVCGCLDGSLHVLAAQSLHEVMVMSNQPHAGSRIDSLAFSPLAGASVWLATDADSRLSIWHFDWNLLGAGVQPNLLRLIHLAHLYSTDYRALTNDIDYSPPALATFSPVHAAQVWCVAPSGDRAAICYDFDAERTVAVVPLYHSPASLAMSPDGCALAFGTEDRCVVLVDTQSGEVEEYHGLPDCVAGVTFSASGSALACCSHAEIHVFSG